MFENVTTDELRAEEHAENLTLVLQHTAPEDAYVDPRDIPMLIEQLAQFDDGTLQEALDAADLDEHERGVLRYLLGMVGDARGKVKVKSFFEAQREAAMAVQD